MKKSRLPLRKKDPLVEKFHFFFIWLVRITLLITLGVAALELNLQTLVIILVAIFLTFLPALIERRYNIDIPIEFEIGIVILVFGSIFLGEIEGYYARFWWWDIMLHTLTGLMVGLVGFLILFVLYKRKRLEAAPITIALFSFSLAAAVGSVWEIFEFAMDQFFGLNMQKSGLLDTMADIIVNNIGAMIAGTAAFVYLRFGEAPLVSRMIHRFKKENPKIAN